MALVIAVSHEPGMRGESVEWPRHPDGDPGGSAPHVMDLGLCEAEGQTSSGPAEARATQIDRTLAPCDRNGVEDPKRAIESDRPDPETSEQRPDRRFDRRDHRFPNVGAIRFFG